MSKAIDDVKPPMATVHLFLPTGKTFTFRDAYVEDVNEHVLILRYIAMSDRRRKHATIQKSTIVGWSIVL